MRVYMSLFSGWITGAGALGQGVGIAPAIIIFIIAGLFTALSVVFFVCLVRVRSVGSLVWKLTSVCFCEFVCIVLILHVL